MTNFYIYIYLDPRKPGRYVYGDYCFLYEPFYVGKGKKDRWKDLKNRNTYFKRIIGKIKKAELKHITIKIKNNLNENKSFILESKLIKLIGRRDLNTGPLINFTNGGEGTSGKITSEKTKGILSRKNKGKNHPMFGRYHSKKTIDKMKKKKKGKNNPFYGKQHSEKTRKLMKNNNANSKGENYSNSKLTEKNVIEIWKYINEGILTQKEIAKKFGVKHQTISDIKRKRSWKYISMK